MLLLAFVLAGCGGDQAGRPAQEPRPRVDSALCDDLRQVVAGRERQQDVRAAAQRVLVQVGAVPVVPEDVVSALRDLEGGAGPDDGLDATVAAYVERECG